MDNRHILSLLGLALRGGNLQVGEGPVGDAIQAHSARVALLACDAAENTRSRTERSAQRENCLCLPLPFTKAELGQALGRASAALAAVTDAGLAAAVVRRLAELDPVRYQEAADLLDKKARRAAERKAQRQVRGKQRPKEQRQKPPERTADAERPRRPKRTYQKKRPKPGEARYAHSHPVKKGKGSFRKRER